MAKANQSLDDIEAEIAALQKAKAERLAPIVAEAREVLMSDEFTGQVARIRALADRLTPGDERKALEQWLQITGHARNVLIRASERAA